MSEETMLACCGDPYYSNVVAIDMLNTFGWSRKRRRKWLRRQKMYVSRTRAVDYLTGDDVEPDVCWCGVKHPYCAPVHGTCGGTGVIDCLCGGDFCICHNHGEVECFGCPDCEDDGEAGFDEGDDF